MVCFHCGCSFTGKDGRKFCSTSCYVKQRYPDHIVVCAVCSGPFKTIPSKARKYCSLPCRDIGRKAPHEALIASGQQRCSKCKNVKDLDQFSNQNPHHRFPSQRKHRWCKACRCANEQKRRRDPRLVGIHHDRYKNDMVYRAKERLRAMYKACKRQGIECDLDDQWLIGKLCGVCELTGLPFDLSLKGRVGSPYAPSIDRITPGGAYTKSNCRVVLFAVNLWMKDFTLEGLMPIAEALVRQQSKRDAA